MEIYLSLIDIKKYKTQLCYEQKKKTWDKLFCLINKKTEKKHGLTHY